MFQECEPLLYGTFSGVINPSETVLGYSKISHYRKSSYFARICTRERSVLIKMRVCLVGVSWFLCWPLKPRFFRKFLRGHPCSSHSITELAVWKIQKRDGIKEHESVLHKLHEMTRDDRDEADMVLSWQPKLLTKVQNLVWLQTFESCHNTESSWWNYLLEQETKEKLLCPTFQPEVSGLQFIWILFSWDRHGTFFKHKLFVCWRVHRQVSFYDEVWQISLKWSLFEL